MVAAAFGVSANCRCFFFREACMHFVCVHRCACIFAYVACQFSGGCIVLSHVDSLLAAVRKTSARARTRRPWTQPEFCACASRLSGLCTYDIKMYMYVLYMLTVYMYIVDILHILCVNQRPPQQNQRSDSRQTCCSSSTN